MFAVMDALADLVYFLIPKGKQVFFIKQTFFQQIEYFTIYLYIEMASTIRIYIYKYDMSYENRHLSEQVDKS